MPDELLALSPIDGRYAAEADSLREYFSEFALIRGRVRVEVGYLVALSDDAGIVRPLSSQERDYLASLADHFSVEDARENKDFERVTRHDVKAVESFLRARLAHTSLADLLEYLHFGLTSEDVNNVVQASGLSQSRDLILVPALDQLTSQLGDMASRHKATVMLARTHGQPAVATTFGKETAVFLIRLKAQRRALAQHRFEAKLTGAVGNYNALAAAAPQIDWRGFADRFIRSMGLEPARVTTQILPYDNWIEYFNSLHLANSILIDLAQDFWQYAAVGYLRLKVAQAETGSSTMPQKVNPIDFENAEGNLGIANALLEQYARKLPISRLQRDLSDSTVRRTFGTALGHALVAYASLQRGLGLIEVDQSAMRRELDAHWEVVAEGAQTILRAAGVSDAYDLLKELTRGRGLTADQYHEWINTLAVDDVVKERLRSLSPSTYTGLAAEIVEQALRDGGLRSQ